MTDPPHHRFGERPGIYHEIVRKMERAMRRGGACTLTAEQLVAILRSPAWMLLAEREREDLLAKFDPPSDSEPACQPPEQIADAGQR